MYLEFEVRVAFFSFKKKKTTTIAIVEILVLNITNT